MLLKAFAGHILADYNFEKRTAGKNSEVKFGQIFAVWP
jgi:hypothetical protein